MNVSHDAGGYYCEHVYFLASKEVEKSGGKAHFLHLRKDEISTLKSASSNEVNDPSRYVDIVAALEKILRHFRDQKKTRFLITGFGPFRDIINNPSGQFLQQKALVQNLMHKVFSIETQMHELGFYAEQNNIALFGELLAVSDDALSQNDPRSIQALITKHRPEIVISMGVGGEEMRAETVASDRNLLKKGARYQHVDDGSPEKTRFTRDYTLASILDSILVYS